MIVHITSNYCCGWRCDRVCHTHTAYLVVDGADHDKLL